MKTIGADMQVWNAKPTGLFVDILKLLLDFNWPVCDDELVVTSSLPEKHMDALRQALELLPLVGRCQDARVSGTQPPLAHYESLQRFFNDCRMVDSWATACCPQDSSTFAAEFMTTMVEALYSDETKRQAFEIVSSERNMKNELLSFKNSLPTEYQSTAVPGLFTDLCVGSLISNVASVGDVQLAHQLQFLCSVHQTLRLADDLKNLRGCDLQIGIAGGGSDINQQSIDRVHRLQHGLIDLQAVLGGLDLDKLFQQRGGPTGHLPDLDGWIDATSFAAFTVKLAKDELSIWSSGWESGLKALSDIIFEGIPPGWDVKKDVLLAEESSDLRKALLANPKFKNISSVIAQLALATTALRKLSSPPFLPVNVISHARAAIVNGTELVTITYALYKLTYIIPKESNKAAAVAALRQECSAKRVALGADLEAEAARLAGASS